MNHHHNRHRLRLLILFLLKILPSLSTADDGAVVLSLAKSIHPLPSGWSTKSSSGFCEWPSIQCDRAGTVTSISLAHHGLSGTLPPELATLANLQNFAVQNNNLNGAIPPFAKLSSLQNLYLDSNNFNSIGSGFLQGLTGLRALSIGDNGNLAPWVLPTYLSDSTGLGNLTAANCSLAGTIPDIFGSLVSLQNLRLSYNNLTGGLPPSMAKSLIQNLWLNNQDMGLTGPIDVLGSMTSLSQVWLHKNAITGPIPDLSQCKKLTDLQLRDNQLTGIVPESVLNLPMLQNVSLGNNKLQGPYPVFSRGVKVDDHGTNSYCDAEGVPCDPQVMVMLEIAKGFGYPSILADAWQGNNACVDWSNVICDNQKKNVISVNLQNKGLIGTISPAFANLTSLNSLYLNNNTLKGPIPDSLTKLTNLRVLDVSNNNLTGKIPQFSTSVKLVTKPGNPFLGKDIKDIGTPGSSGGGRNDTTPGGSTSGTKKGISIGIIAVIIAAIVIVICVLLYLLCKYKKKQGKFGRKESLVYGKELVKKVGSLGRANGYNKWAPRETHHGTSSGDNGGMMFEVGNVTVSIEVLREVTNNFSEDNILGRGGFGVVYKGELHDGTKIAVKRMESGLIGTKGLNEFQAEIAVLSKVRHRHLVGLHGYCVNGNERLLVYEYMPQGTLAQHLFDRHDSQYSPLTWKQRVSIALDVARAVEYMHNLAQQSFIHRDLKPSNILLGDDMRAKVSDFGLVKNAPDGKYSVETRLAGTFGYLAPEYAATGRVTTKVDVFAFGVVVMEMITGRKALDDSLPDEMSHLVTWFRRVLINKEHIRKAIDETLDSDEETLESIYKVAELAGHCTAAEPSQRPDMGHAVNVLAPLVEQWTPSGHHEDSFGIDLHMSLSQAVQRWKASEDSPSMTFDDSSYSQSQSSIPPKPSGIGDTFNSSDAR